MDDRRPRHRFLSSFIAFIIISSPIAWYFIVVIIGSDIIWFPIINFVGGVVVGAFYARRPYSLSQLWDFVWKTWKGLVITSVVLSAISITIFDMVLFDLQRPGSIAEQILFGGLGFVLFIIIYGSSYQSSYLD